MRIHHFGIVVENINKSAELYESLCFVRVGEMIIDNIQNNKLLFLKNCDTLIELIEPLNEHSTVIGSHNIGYRHICFEVDDLDGAIMDFKVRKIGKIITDKIQAPAFENRKVVFAVLKDGNMIEFVEKSL
jgi:catechol 2,3-dioxygenase-like lactoylglutathione lyase family enzyme